MKCKNDVLVKLLLLLVKTIHDTKIVWYGVELMDSGDILLGRLWDARQYIHVYS